MADYGALTTELASPAYAGLSDADAAALLNTPGTAVPGMVAPTNLLKWGAKSGVRAAIEAGVSVPQIASICLTVRDLLTTGVVGLDVSDADNILMLGALVASGVMTAAQRDELVALGSSPGPSRAALIFGVPVSDHDVNHARSL